MMFDIERFLDLLDMKNEEILKENDGKKFDIVLMNPPYGSTGNDVTHLKFVEKCLDIADKQITVMPFSFITKTAKVFNKFKEQFSKYLLSVDEVDSREFTGTAMSNVGIYNFNIHKKENETINITRLNNKNSQEVNSLLDISEFNDYEKEIIKYLKEQGQQPGTWAAGHSHDTKNAFIKRGYTDDEKIKEEIKKVIISMCKAVPKDKVLITLPQANFSARFVSGRYGEIFDNYDDFIKFVTTTTASSGYNVLVFNTKKEAENCKIALQNPLLRFTLYRTKDDQNMTYKKCYKYIPNIDWSDDRVKTDEGLLEVCGCPKDKCKEYAEYCKKIINEVDRKK